MTLNILYCSDNNYAPYLGISMVSVMEHNKDAEKIVFYVVSDRISEDNVARLKRQVEKYGESRQLVFIDGQAWVEQLVAMDILPYRGGQATNLRLFFMEYIAKDVDRLLYLDCDTIIQGDLTPMFETEMESTAAAVVLDSLSGVDYKKIIGFTEEDQYFNAGVILFNVKNWVAHECEKTLRANMKDPKQHLPNNDQDFLNILLKDDKTILSPKYNFQTTHQVYSNKTYFSTYKQPSYYTKEEIDEARNAPVILHAYRFLGQFPWHKSSLHPWTALWWEYVAKSEWSDLSPKENQGTLFKIERIIFRLTPKAIFLPLLQKWQTHTFKKRFNLMQRKGEK